MTASNFFSQSLRAILVTLMAMSFNAALAEVEAPREAGGEDTYVLDDDSGHSRTVKADNALITLMTQPLSPDAGSASLESTWFRLTVKAGGSGWTQADDAMRALVDTLPHADPDTETALRRSMAKILAAHAGNLSGRITLSQAAELMAAELRLNPREAARLVRWIVIYTSPQAAGSWSRKDSIVLQLLADDVPPTARHALLVEGVLQSLKLQQVKFSLEHLSPTISGLPAPDAVDFIEGPLADSLRGLGDPAEALQILSFTLPPTIDQQVRNRLLYLQGATAYEAGRPELTLQLLETLEDEPPTDEHRAREAEASLLKSLALLSLDRLNEADNVLESIDGRAAAQEVLARRSFLRGWIRLSTDDFDGATEHFSVVVQDYPESSFRDRAAQIIEQLATLDN